MASGNEEVRDIVVEQAGTPTQMEIVFDSQKAIARISSISQVIDGCVKASIQRTNAKDWVKMGSGYYMQATAAQKIRPIWGIYYRDRQVTKEVNADGTYGYIVTGKVGSKLLDQLYGEVEVDIDGGRSSNDSFFAGKDGNKAVDPMDVRKAALANWEARAVAGLLGLKNLSADDLKRNGILVDQISGVEYAKGAEGGGQTNLISDAQRKRLFAICKEANIAENHLKAYLIATHKIDSTSKITRSIYERVCNWVQAGGAEVPAENQKREVGEGE